MGDWFKVGEEADFVEGRGLAVDAGTECVAVFRVAGRLHAMQNACPHMRASLADGRIDGGRRVICHMHGWTFDLQTGKPEGGRANCARVYTVEVRGTEVYVRIPRPAPTETAGDDDWVPWSDEFLRDGRDGT